MKIDWVKIGSYVIIFILAFLLFKSCQSNKEVQLANERLKKEVKDLIDTTDLIAGKNRQLRDTISILEARKQKIKTQIVYIKNKAKSDVKKVAGLNTIEISEYYSERYHLEVKPTPEGVVFKDTVSKENIKELIEGDACLAEIKLVRYNLEIEEKIGIAKDTLIDNLSKENYLLNDAIVKQKEIISNTEKSVRKENRKKNFWKFISMLLVTGSIYVVAK